MRKDIIYVIFFLQYLLTEAWGLIGYDCGSKALNISTLSLIDVGQCDILEDTIKSTKQYVQLLQVNEFTEVRVMQCKVEIHRTIYHCGMHSHISIVRNGESEYIQDTNEYTCREMHRSGSLKIGFAQEIHGLRLNATISRSLTFAGSIHNDGTCHGVFYSDPYGSWESVVVQGTVKVTLTAQTARVSLQNDQLHLPSGTTCPLSSGTCIDMVGGHTFWKPMPVDYCKFSKYGVLYEGLADKITDLQTVYSLTTQDITFALTARGTENICGYMVIRTEHPKLFVFETTKDNSFAKTQKVSVSNLDLFAYMNSKFVYVEKHVRTQIKYLYRDIVYQRCNLERQTLKNALAIATQAPDEFAFHLMKGPGYMAVVAGEVVHIVKCIPVEVTVQHGNHCFSELQVSKENTTYFLTPRTHILKRKGIQIPCNSLLPSYYYIGDIWYKILPRPTESKNPLIMKPMTRPTWKYQDPSSLATSGIYSQKDLQELNDRIMFPVEQAAILNDFAREMNGLTTTDNEGILLKLLNEDAVSKIIESTWDRTWKRFLTFGTASAGLIGIIIIIKGIKIVADVLVRGYTLHSVFGWSYRLLGAMWSSVAHLLLFLSQGPPPTPPSVPTSTITRDIEANIPQSVKTSQHPGVSQPSHFPQHPNISQHASAPPRCNTPQLSNTSNHSEAQNKSDQQSHSVQNTVEILNKGVSYFSYPDLN